MVYQDPCMRFTCEIMLTAFCVSCGQELRKGHAFCPRCGTRAEPVTPSSSQPSPVPVVPTQPPQTRSNNRGGLGKVVIIALLILVILIVPVFPRDRVVYVDGVTQTVTLSTSYNTVSQVYASPTLTQISVYQGSLQYVPDQYYNQYYQNNYGYPLQQTCNDYSYYYSYYWYPNNYYSYPYYSYPYYCNNYGSYNYPYYSSNYPYNYANTVTVNPSDNVVRVQQSQESTQFWTLILTHYDGTSNTYSHVFQQSLTQSGTSTIPGTTTVTNTITNSAVNPVATQVPCQNCIPQHVTDHVSLLQLIFG